MSAASLSSNIPQAGGAEEAGVIDGATICASVAVRRTATPGGGVTVSGPTSQSSPASGTSAASAARLSALSSAAAAKGP